MTRTKSACLIVVGCGEFSRKTVTSAIRAFFRLGNIHACQLLPVEILFVDVELEAARKMASESCAKGCGIPLSVHSSFDKAHQHARAKGIELLIVREVGPSTLRADFYQRVSAYDTVIPFLEKPLALSKQALEKTYTPHKPLCDLIELHSDTYYALRGLLLSRNLEPSAAAFYRGSTMYIGQRARQVRPGVDSGACMDKIPHDIAIMLGLIFSAFGSDSEVALNTIKASSVLAVDFRDKQLHGEDDGRHISNIDVAFQAAFTLDVGSMYGYDTRIDTFVMASHDGLRL